MKCLLPQVACLISQHDRTWHYFLSPQLAADAEFCQFSDVTQSSFQAGLQRQVAAATDRVGRRKLDRLPPLPAVQPSQAVEGSMAAPVLKKKQNPSKQRRDEGAVVMRALMDVANKEGVRMLH